MPLGVPVSVMAIWIERSVVIKTAEMAAGGANQAAS